MNSSKRRNNPAQRVGASPPSLSKNSDEQRILLAYRQATALIRRKNVENVGVAKAITKGKITSNDCITIVVNKKLPQQEIAKQRLKILPREINGIKVDVVEASKAHEIKFRVLLRKATPSIAPGSWLQIFLENGDIENATICLILFNTSGKKFLITANHAVLGSIEKLQIIDNESNVIPFTASLTSQLSNFDTAVLAFHDFNHSNIPLNSTERIVDYASPRENQELQLAGSQTSATKAIVELPLSDEDSQIFISHLSGTYAKRGDSGGLWFDKTTKKAIGLHLGRKNTDNGIQYLICRLDKLFNSNEMLGFKIA